MLYSILLTLGLLILAHFIGDWSKFVPFHQKVVNAKVNKTNTSGNWIFLHSSIVSLYKIFAILISSWIIPIGNMPGFLNTIWFYIILVVIFFGELITHFVFDISKWFLNNKYNLNPSKDIYWTVVGIDQMLHYLVMLGMLYLLYC